MTRDSLLKHLAMIPAPPPLIDVRHLSKYFGSVIALKDISLRVRAGEVMGLLSDNGAGKSTLIKCLAGVYAPDEGRMLIEGREVRFASPREALAHGIATAYQDLAMIPLMSVACNFFLGAEPTTGWGPLRRFDVRQADRVTREALAKMGIDIRDTAQPVGTLSGGERQSLAIARAVYFGAKVLILDEPTSALGVKEAGVVLRYNRAGARTRRSVSSSSRTTSTMPIRSVTVLPSSTGAAATAPSIRPRSPARRCSR